MLARLKQCLILVGIAFFPTQWHLTAEPESKSFDIELAKKALRDLGADIPGLWWRQERWAGRQLLHSPGAGDPRRLRHEPPG